MAFQLPSEVHGFAAGVLVYSFICEVASLMLVWLVWTHRERTSYIAWIAYFTLVSTTASIAQQFRVYVLWDDVITEQFYHSKKHMGNPELVISNGSVGIDLVLFYIQYCCYLVEATFVLFWAFSLTQSVYGWLTTSRLRRIFKTINVAGKVASIVLPVTVISLLQLEAVQSTFVGFILTADMLLIISLAGSCSFLLAILRKYLQSRRRFSMLNAGYNQNPIASNTTPTQDRPQGIYDRWLLLRFTIGFIFLSAFELTNILFQLASSQNIARDSLSDEPDLSASRAHRVSVLFMPGVTPGLLAFVVFGTTKPFREYMYKTFVPKRFQRPDASTARESSLWRASRSSTALSSHRSTSSVYTSQGHAYGQSIDIAELKKLRLQQHGHAEGTEDEWPMLKGTQRVTWV
ncbi:hypothetical protein F5B20DRAFT_167787 [Whalleya microplaca]|nr:hypothetical protein F5B20DRAFT_167787 [Whalleya microplaca]